MSYFLSKLSVRNMEKSSPDKTVETAPFASAFRKPQEEDAGEWAYDHRHRLVRHPDRLSGVGCRLRRVEDRRGAAVAQTTVYIDLNTLADLEQERDRLERQLQERQVRQQEEFDWKSVKNVSPRGENVLNET